MKALKNTLAVSLMAVLALGFIVLIASTSKVYADEPEKYPVWVEGIQVTSENKDGIQTDNVKENLNSTTHPGIAEIISFDPDTNTLTIKTQEYIDPRFGNTNNIVTRIKQKNVSAGDTASGDGIDDGKLAAAIYSEDIDLTINVTGGCDIENPAHTDITGAERDAAIYVKGGSLTIEGDGYLHTSRCADKSRVIYTDGDLDISGSLEIYSYLRGSATEIRGIEAKGNIDIYDGAYAYIMTGSYNSMYPKQYPFVCGGVFTVSDAPVETEKYKWSGYTDPDDGTVYAQISHPGKNNDIAIQAEKLAIENDASVKISNTAQTSDAGFTGVQADVAISEDARLDIGANSQTNGSVGIKGNVRASGSSVVRIAGGAPDIGIQLDGTSELSIEDSARIEATGNQHAIDGISDAVSEYLKTIGGSVNTTASATDATDWDLETPLDQYKYVSLPGYYQIWVEGTAITGINKNDVLEDGKVSYDPESHKLTLDDAAIETAKSGASNNVVAGIYSLIKDTVIELKGENTIKFSELAGAAIKADEKESGNLTIIGTGSLDISLDSKQSEDDPRGIAANGLTIQDATLKLNMTGQKALGSTNVDHFLTGISANSDLSIEDAKVELSLQAAKNNSMVGLYSSNSGNVNIKGTSDVKINIGSDGTGAAYNLSGISGNNIFGSPAYNRSRCTVTLSDDAKLDIDLSKADSENSIGTSIGSYGYVHVKGNSALSVKVGKSNHSYGVGAYPSPWQKGGSTVNDSAYTRTLYVYDNAKVEIEAEHYASISSVEASGSAIVILNGGTAGTFNYQGVKASDNAIVQANGGEYGISGVLQVNGDADVAAKGSVKAIRGQESESDIVGSGRPFDSSENDGLVVDLREHNKKTADVNTEAESGNCSEWNGTDKLGGDDSTFKYVSIPMHDHVWDSGKVTTQPTTKKTGVMTFTCTICGRTRTESIPKISASEALDNGASVEAAEEVITSYPKETDPAGSKFAPAMLKSTKQTKSSIKLTWKKVSKASKYIVFGSPCGKKNKLKKIKTVKGTSLNVKKIAGKKLKKGKYYKFIVVAAGSNNHVVTTSKLIHVSTSGSKKAANNKKVVVKAKVTKTGKKLKKYKKTSAIAIKKGKSTTLKATATKAKKTKVSKHVAVRYESSNPKVAKVTAKGSVKGLKKGSCKIYVYAQNGVSKVIKVKVK